MIRILLKSGVLGVLGVPESLQASNDEAFSDGTPLQKHENTCVQNTNGVPEKTYKACTSHPAQPDGDAEGVEGCRFMSMNDDDKTAGGTQRWSQQYDESGRLEWIWQPDAPDDLDALFERVDNQKGTFLDNELHGACMLDRFISQAGFNGEGAVEPWILQALYHIFFRVLSGAEWNNEITLPGRPVRLSLSEKELRDWDLFDDIRALISRGDCNVTDAIRRTAESYCVSYETSRAAYYKLKKEMSAARAILSKNSENT